MLFLILACILVLAGCDTDRDKSVTGYYATTGTRALSTVIIPPDSLTVATTFNKNIGTSSYALAGRYEGIESYAVFKFNVERINKANILNAFVTFDIENVWKEGATEFELYETHSDWADTLLLDQDDFLGSLGTPISYASDANISEIDTSYASITFPVNASVIKSWDIDGSVLVKGSDACMSMVNILSDDTSYPPLLKLVKQYTDGSIDTTNVSSKIGSYFMNTGMEDGGAVVSEGSGAGYVLHIGVPAEVPSLAVINKCIIRMTMPMSVIPEDVMSVGFYRLTSAFTTIEDAEKDTGTYELINLDPEIETYDIDIAEIVSLWHAGGEKNYGILIEPLNEGLSPNQCLFTAVDSIEVTYTVFPDVK